VPLAALLPPPPPSPASLAPSPALPARRRLVWRSLVRAALAAAPGRAEAAAPFERLAAAAAHSEAAAFGGGGGRGGFGGEDEDECVAAGAPGPSSPAATPAGCAALRAFIRSAVVPWLPAAGPAPAGVGGPGGPTVDVDELTLRARDAERACGKGAKAGGVSSGL
jgi:hypothetical protein